MSRTPLDYGRMVQDALRGVVREALAASVNGLPGYHHFKIAFDTRHPGVEMAEYLRERYPDQILIVLQHQFWGLEVERDWFEVTLQFNRINERLHIPYGAITGFSDPSAKFDLQFTIDAEDMEPAPGVTRLMPAPAPAALPAPAAAVESAPPAPAAAAVPAQSAQVVTLDAFRKK